MPNQRHNVCPKLEGETEIARLDELSPHEYGVVEGIDANSEEMERLMSMGVCPGRLIELVMAGDPLILKVYGTRIGLSARLAERVTVKRGLPRG